MRLLLVDGYKKANFLLQQMVCQEHEIVFLHDDKAFAEKMLERYEIEVYTGNASNPHVLESIENKNFDVIVTLSNSDNKNFVICTLAKRLLNVKKTISLISNPNNKVTFQSLGVDIAVSASHIITKIIKKVVIEENIGFISLDDDQVNSYELTIKKEYKSVGKQIKDLKFPNSSIVCSIIRDEKAIIPTGENMIEENDKLLIFSYITKIEDIKKVLN